MSIWMLLVIGVLTLIISSMFRNQRNQQPPFPRSKEPLDAEVLEEISSGSSVPPPLPPRRRTQPPPLPRARRTGLEDAIPVAKAVPSRPTAATILDMATPILTETKIRSAKTGQLAAMLKDRNSLRSLMQLREVLAPPLCKRRK